MKLQKLDEILYKISLDIQPPPTKKEEEMVNFYEQNKTPLFVLERIVQTLGWPIPQKLISEKKDYHKRLLDGFLKIQQEWEREEITAVFIKSVGHFPSESDNLDILIPENRYNDAVKILENYGLRELKFLREPFKRLFRNFKNGKPFLAIHLHTDIGWITPFIDREKVLKEAIHSDIDPGIFVPPPLHQSLTHLAHGFFENKEFTLREVIFILLSSGGDISKQLTELQKLEARKFGWEEGYRISMETLSRKLKNSFRNVRNESIANSTNMDIQKIQLPIRFSKIKVKILHLLQSTKTRRKSKLDTLKNPMLVGFYTAKVLSGISLAKPVHIALSGPDGAGKTTIAKKLSYVLSSVQINPEVFWWRVGSAGMVEKISRTIRKGEEKRKIKKSMGNPSITSYVWALLGVVERWARTFLHWIPIRYRPTLVIYDRYAIDDYFDIMRKLQGKGGKIIATILLKALPNPHRTYLIIPTLDTLCDRLSTVDKSDIQNLYNYYNKLTEKGYDHRIKNLTCIEGNKRLEDILDQILNDIGRFF